MLAVNTRSVEFDNACGLEGFTVTLSYQSRQAFEKLREDSQIQKIDDNGLPFKELDRDTYIKNYVTSVVKGWKGFTYAMLSELILIDESLIDNMDEEIPFDVEYAIFLMEKSERFDLWVTSMIRKLDNFRK